MNKLVISGRMTKNPMEFGSGENIGARFTIAVDE
jgi:hypothetical protein